jgi:hypothetical protein
MPPPRKLSYGSALLSDYPRQEKTSAQQRKRFEAILVGKHLGGSDGLRTTGVYAG